MAAEEGDWTIDDLLALEDELLQELQRESVERATYEAEWLDALQSEEDSELFEQHSLSGVPCPLCGGGRLENRQGELRCTSCEEMCVLLMDESLSLDDVSEMLGLAEARHRETYCISRACFELDKNCVGPRELYLRCDACGWRDMVL